MDEQCATCDHCTSCDFFMEYERTEEMQGITKSTFQEMDTNSKLDVLFDYMHDIHEAAPRRVRDRNRKCAEQVKECADKFEELGAKVDNNEKMFRRTRIINGGIVLIGSFVGGWSAVWTSFKLGFFPH
jgi:hypothetical protein